MTGKKQTKKTIDKTKKTVIIKEIAQLLEERYVYEDMGKKMSKNLLEKLVNGFFDEINLLTIFAVELEKSLHELCNDKHLHLLYNDEMLEQIKIESSADASLKKKQKELLVNKEKEANFGFKKLEILEGNIGYLDLRGFHNSNEAFEIATFAMNFLKNTNAIIIDLCNNGGGETEMVQLLASYFLEMRSQLNYIIRRYEGVTEQYWSLPYVPGTRMLNKKLFLLTSSSTFSAAEDFIYSLKCQKRVTIVGEQTKGGGHPVDFYPIFDTYVLMLPNARAYNPICKGNWEERGISPHVSVSAKKALFTAHQLALDHSISKETDGVKKLFLQLAKEKTTALHTKVKVNPSTLEKYAGLYESTLITFENNKLIWKTNANELVELTPITETAFYVNQPGFARISLMFEIDSETNEKFIHYLYERDLEIFTRKCIN